MDLLTKSLLEDLLENPTTVALYGGGFKPPTKGHFNVVEKTLEELPDIDQLILYIGGGEREGITQEESLKVWDIYKNYLSPKITIEPSIAPIKSILNYAKNNPTHKVYWILGARDRDEGDLADIANRTRSIDKYPNLEVKVITSSGGVSGTKTRQAIKSNNKEQFLYMIPDVEEKEEIWDILKPAIKESKSRAQILKERQQKIQEGFFENMKTKFQKFLAALKQEGQETKEAVELLIHAAQGKIELSDEDKEYIGNQLKDVLKIIGLIGIATLPGGIIAAALIKLFKAESLVTPSAFTTEGTCGYDTDVATGKKLDTPGGLEEGRPKKKDPKKGTGKKPEGSGRRLYTDEDPKDTVRIKFKTKEDIVDTLNKKQFKAKSHARQSQVINLIHQRVRAAYGKAKDPEVRSRLKRALDYIEKRKEMSKKKTERLRKLKEEKELNVQDLAYQQIPGLLEKGISYGLNHFKSFIKSFYKWSGTKDKNDFFDFIESLNGEIKRVPLNSIIPSQKGKDYKNASSEYEAEEFLKILNGEKSVEDHRKEDFYPIVVNKRDNKIIDGNHRHYALSSINSPYAVVLYIDVPEKYLQEASDPQAGTALPYGSGFAPVKELVTATEVICDNCGWEWDKKDGGKDLYICHKCGHDNNPEYNSLDVNEGDTYEKMAAKGKQSGNLKQGTVRARLNIPKDEKVPMSKINKELARLKKMDQDDDKKGVQLGDKNQKYYKALQLAKTLKSTTNINENDPFGLKELAKTFVKEVFEETWNPQKDFLSLCIFMKDNGMNITPLPKIKVIKDDEENASRLLGKTAYYNPTDKSITLYTLGRHPKDVLRSFAHEMVHHEQNLNGTLGNITTTNTNEDDHLKEIEKEAYLKGNIMFRNWEDSIKNV